MTLLISGFEGLGETDFDVYRPACWSSNLHNLDRMRTKARVLALLERVRAGLGDTGLVVGASSEIPSVWNGRQVKDQWAYLLRSEEARRQLQPVMARSTDLATKVKDPAEHHQHVLLSLQLDHEGLEMGLRIHPHATVDLANLIGHAEVDPAGFVSALAGLSHLTTPTALLAAARAAQQGGSWVVVGERMPKAQVVAAGLEVADRVVTAAQALLPLLHFVAWTPENDHVGVQRQVAALAEEVEQKREVAEAEREVADAEREARRQEARERTEAQVAELRAWKAGLRARREEQQADRNEREAEERKKWEAQQAERAAAWEAQQAERAVARAAEEAARAAEDAAKAADLAERVARARHDAQEAIKAAEARKIAEAQRKAAPAPARPAREAGPRKAPPSRPQPERGAPRKAAPAEGRPAEGRAPEGRAPEGRPAEGRPPEARKDEARAEAPKAAAKPAEAGKHLVVGDRCRLARGLLAGKEGVVRSVDEKKGYYQVRVGALDVNIAFADAAPIS